MIWFKQRYRNTESFSAHIVAAMVAGGVSLLLHLAFFLVFGDSPVSYVLDFGQTKDGSSNRKPSVVERVDKYNPADELSGDNIGELVLSAAEFMGLMPSRPGETPRSTLPEETAPPTVPGYSLDAALSDIALPPESETFEQWQPRRDIIAVETPQIDDSLALLPRIEIPWVERVSDTPDIIPPFELHASVIGVASNIGESAISGRDVSPFALTTDLPVEDLTPDLTVPGSDNDISTRITDPDAAAEDGITQQIPKALESLLQSRVTAVSLPSEPGSIYFSIEIDRITPEKLPSLPKDILFVQDCSRSIDEARLHFCREMLSEHIKNQLSPGDRFNVISFAEDTRSCFETWSSVNDSSISHALKFVSEMKSVGETDLYGAMLDLAEIRGEEGRPMIAILITDGRPTVGTLESSRIISGFTALNRGNLSVFTLGTSKTKNDYLLNQLSYCNRGDSAEVKGGRWGIPDAFNGLAGSLARPVLCNVNFIFDSGFRGEIYPLQTTNLYEDRPLILYGKCDADVSDVTFQATGKAGSAPCDMIFRLPIRPAAVKDADQLRQKWAEQKVYALMGMLAADPDPLRKSEMLRTMKIYGVNLPYAFVH